MDSSLFGTLSGLKLTSRKQRITDDDFVDRLNRSYTTTLLIIFSIVICTKQYIIGQPLQCWVPAEFNKGWEKYAENYCWVKNTYFVPSNLTELPTRRDDRVKKELPYYQWVPFILAIQALMFYLPSIFWRMLNWQAGVRITSLVEKANDAKNVDLKDQEDCLDLLARQMNHTLIRSRIKGSGFAHISRRVLTRLLFFRWSKSGNYLLSLYLVTKVIYVANILCQFGLLTRFLQIDFWNYGFNILNGFRQGRTWYQTGFFPRVTYCDFKIRSVGQHRDYSLQCVLIINLFNEKIYVCLWFWLLFLLVVTAGSALIWILWSVWPDRKYKSLAAYLKKDGYPKETIRTLAVEMETDGVFVLKLMAINCGEVIVHDLVRKLYKRHFSTDPEKDADATTPETSSSIVKKPPSSRISSKV